MVDLQTVAVLLGNFGGPTFYVTTINISFLKVYIMCKELIKQAYYCILLRLWKRLLSAPAVGNVDLWPYGSGLYGA